MSMKALEDLREMLCTELDEIAKKQDLSSGDLETVHKLTDTIKNIDKIEMLEESEYSGYSRDGGSYNSYANRGQHYVRGHYSRESGRGGSYRGGSSRNSYSRNSDLMEEMERLMGEAETEKERRAIEKCLTQMENV